MGYESKIYIHCDKNAYNKLENIFWSNGYFTPDKISGEVEEEHNIISYLIEYDWVKWYEDNPEYYPEVDEIMSILSELEKDNSKGSFGYLRIGEEYEDVETRCNDEKYRLYPQIDLYRDSKLQNMKEIAHLNIDRDELLEREDIKE